MSETVWQPEYLSDPSYGFAVRIDGEFSQQLSEHTVPSSYQENLNEFIADAVLPEFGIRYTDPVRFYEDTFCPSSFHIGNNGTWLATDETHTINTDADVSYQSHNVDTGTEAYALMAMVDQWAEAATGLLADDA
jgi:hypothetical protein